MPSTEPAAATLVALGQPSVPWLLGTAAAFALLLVLRSRGRVDRAWAALLAPGTWRWGLVLAGAGIAACMLPVAGALPAVLGADCAAAAGAQSVLRLLAVLLLLFGAGGVLCIAARAMLLPAIVPTRWNAWPAAGRAVGTVGLACLAYAWASMGSGLAALARSPEGSVQPLHAAWAAQARDACRTAAISAPVSVAGTDATATVAPVLAANAAQERLLTEIRDLLREQQRRAAQAVSLPPIPPAYVPPRPEAPRPEVRPTLRRPVQPRPAAPFYGYPYEY